MLDFVYSTTVVDPLASSSAIVVRPDPALANALKAAAPLGTLIGQVVFGRLADKAGRKRMCTSLHPCESTS